MARKLGARLQARVFNGFIGFGAWLAQKPAAGLLVEPLFAALGRAAARAGRVHDAVTPAQLAQEWQKAFPSKKLVPIVAVDERTAHAEIHQHCPLRGSGDTRACHRMMAYDRAVAARAGGQFVVLQSQAMPGVTVCKVALRRAEDSTQGLTPAYRPEA
jgi:hypothetical protein